MLQDPFKVLQGVAVDQAPPAGVTLTQVVCMVQANPSPRAATTLQPADMEVQVADAALRLLLVILVEAFSQSGTTGMLHACNGLEGSLSLLIHPKRRLTLILVDTLIICV